MSIYAHLDTLNEKHQTLSMQIRDAYKHHEADHHLVQLKKKRLLLEEEIEKYYGIATQTAGEVASAAA